MKHVYTSAAIAEAIMIKAVLKDEHIPAMIKNESLSGGITTGLYATGMQVPDAWPEVWILEDKDLERAEKIVADWSEATVEEQPTSL
jgi:hypothetical protein